MSATPAEQAPTLHGVGALPPALPEPTNLTVAIRVAQRMLAAFGDSSGLDEFGYAEAHGALSESLRILLRALDSEPETEQPAADTHTPVGPGCGAPATVRIEGYSPRNGRLHGSLDLAVYACEQHTTQARDTWLGNLLPHTTRYVTDARCGQQFDFTSLDGGEGR